MDYFVLSSWSPRPSLSNFEIKVRHQHSHIQNLKCTSLCETDYLHMKVFHSTSIEEQGRNYRAVYFPWLNHKNKITGKELWHVVSQYMCHLYPTEESNLLYRTLKDIFFSILSKHWSHWHTFPRKKVSPIFI